MTTTNLRLAGLFAGVGGIELGFEKAGFNPIFANEIDAKASITYRLNHSHELVTKDIKSLESKELPKIDVLTGGFPCQAFSVAGYQKGFKDPRGNVFWEIIRLLEDRKPEIVFLENVKNLGTHDGGKTFRIILQALASTGYHVEFDVLNSDGYGGVPQNRERIYIVGFRSKKYASRFEFPGKLKKTPSLSDFIDFENRVHEDFYYEDRYMTKDLKKSMKRMDTVYQWRRQYVRENKSGVCPTLTANMGTGGHNVPLILTQHGIRKLTPKECFNLMGFPKSFKLPKDMALSHLYKQAGNAVVVPVIERIARNILASINGEELPSTKQEQKLILL
jgi:DNA (cytosine-5)-methyltransferase 1